MAYTLKGFYSMPALADNGANGVVARFGELSAHSRTFTRDEKNFVNPSYPNIELVTFKLVNEGDVSTTPSTAFTNKLLALGNWLYNQHVGGNIPSDANKQTFIDAIATEISGLSNIEIGQIINGITTSRNLIDYIAFNVSDNDKKYNVKIWCSDSKFRSQYENFIIMPIPPIDVIDDLHTNVTALANRLSEVTPAYIVDIANALADNKPYTKLASLQLTWHDPENSQSTYKTNWYFIVHGDLGLDIDNQKNAVREYISQNSDKTNWDKVYPELYSENEFIIIPLWENMALPDGSASVGLYSSMVDYGKISDIAKTRIPTGYAQITNINTFINKWLKVMAVYYRGMQVLALANPSNAGSYFDLREKFPDYTCVSTTDVDFSRMEPLTREFIIQLNTALEYARTMSTSAVAPVGFNKITRGNRQYLTFNVEGHYFLVLIKSSY